MSECYIIRFNDSF